MRLRIPRFRATLALVLLATPFSAAAQQPKTTARIGFLSSYSPERESNFLAGFQQGLRELGYLEGRDIFIEPRYAGGHFQKLPGLAAELTRLKVDILFTAGTPAAVAAKNATTVIPIVMTLVADPVGTGLVASLARPGGNITGLSDFNAGVVAKRLELLKEVVPSASRVAVLYNPANPTNPLQLELIQAVAPALGVTLLSWEAQGADDIDRAFTAMSRQRPEALIVIGDPLFGTHRKRIVEFSVKTRLPATYSNREWAEAGGLMSYGASFHDLYRRAATYVHKILKGAKPADLPIEQPMKFELIINLKTAKALGLTIPPTLLFQADEIIR
jgi:putative tryptophan/tyrosine transport system substrate-binding protein